MEENTSFFDKSGTEVFTIFHPTPYVWWITTLIGLAYGLYRYGRSLKYLYYYYIEHGHIVWWMDNYQSTMKEVVKKHKLYEHFTCQGYVGGLGIILVTTFLGWLIGILWPITVVIGILTVPNLLIRYVAREKRAKAVFHQTLAKDDK